MRHWSWVAVGVAVLAASGLLLRRQGTSIGRGEAVTPRPARAAAGRGDNIVYAAQDPSISEVPWSLDVFVMKPDGSQQKNLTHSKAAECDPALSPDGARVAFGVLAGEEKEETGIYTMRADGGDRRRITPSGTIACSPSWSPDGQQIAFTHVVWKVGDQGRFEYETHVELVPADGGTAKKLTAGWNPAWAPDGAHFLFTGKDGSLCLIPSSGGLSRVLVKAGDDSGAVTGSWSPDGRRIVYTISGSGDQFIMNGDGSGRRRLPQGAVTGAAPQWSPDGKWIFYTRSGDLKDSISEIWRVGADGKNPKRMVQGKAFTGGFGWTMIGWLGIGREEAAAKEPPPGPTIGGTEEPGLTSRLHGFLVTTGEAGGLEAISLPDLQRRPIVSPAGAGTDAEASIYYHAGPDRNGRVVYVENFMEAPPAKSHFTLNVIHLDGTGKQVLFTRQGDALWDHAISENLALSADGKVAFASHPKDAQMPAALLQTGSLEIWDLEKGTGRETNVTVVDQGFSWFPDGRQLAYVRLAPRAEAGELPRKPDQFGAEFAGWPTVPTVYLLDTVTGKSRPLHPGWNPTVSADGTSVVVSDYQQRLRRVDVKTGSSTPLELPGYWGKLTALPAPDLAIYWSLPTKGQKQRWTKSNSPLVGPKQEVAIKVGVPDTQRFATLLPYVDPRQQVTYGNSRPGR